MFIGVRRARHLATDAVDTFQAGLDATPALNIATHQSVSSCNSASTSAICACYTLLTFDIIHPPTHTLSRRLRLTAFCTQGSSSPFITFRVSRRRREMYIGHDSRASVCLSVRGRLPTLPHVPGCNLGNGRGCHLVVHYWVNLQSAHGLRWYDNKARTRNVSKCLYSLYAWFLQY